MIDYDYLSPVSMLKSKNSSALSSWSSILLKSTNWFALNSHFGSISDFHPSLLLPTFWNFNWSELSRDPKNKAINLNDSWWKKIAMLLTKSDHLKNDICKISNDPNDTTKGPLPKRTDTKWLKARLPDWFKFWFWRFHTCAPKPQYISWLKNN